MSNWLIGSIDEGKDAMRNLAFATFGMVFEERHVNVLHERALSAVCTTKGLIATSTLKGLLLDRYDLQRQTK